MQSVAIISDIHGNLQALKAVLSDIERQGNERIYCLGDLVGKGPNPTEVVGLLFDYCDVIIRGNWDELVCKARDNEQFYWHAKRLSEKQLERISRLPFSYDFNMSGRHIRIFHASPQSVFNRIQPWDTHERLLSMFDFTSSLTEPLHPCHSPDVVIYGDIHKAYLQHLQGKTLVNCGSVGNPFDMTQASYITLQGHFGQVQPSEFSIHFHRIPYDIEQAVRAAEQSDMPGFKSYIRELRTGVYRGLQQHDE